MYSTVSLIFLSILITHSVLDNFNSGFLSLSLFISQIYSIDIENYPIFDNPP